MRNQTIWIRDEKTGKSCEIRWCEKWWALMEDRVLSFDELEKALEEVSRRLREGER